MSRNRTYNASSGTHHQVNAVFGPCAELESRDLAQCDYAGCYAFGVRTKRPSRHASRYPERTGDLPLGWHEDETGTYCPEHWETHTQAVEHVRQREAAWAWRLEAVRGVRP